MGYAVSFLPRLHLGEDRNSRCYDKRRSESDVAQLAFKVRNTEAWIKPCYRKWVAITVWLGKVTKNVQNVSGVWNHLNSLSHPKAHSQQMYPESERSELYMHHFPLLFSKQNQLVAQTIICLQYRGPGFDPWVRKMPWRKKQQPTPVFLPGETHGPRSLAGLQSMGWQVSDTTVVFLTLAFFR